MLLLLAFAGVRAAFAQPLVCPTSPSVSGKACETFHFHVQMYRPDTRVFESFYGINQFASQTACDQAREVQINGNAAIIDYYRKVQKNQQVQPDRFGPCHCDMTMERSNPNFLTDAQRATQIRMAEEIRERVRERLLDAGLSSDSELVRGIHPLARVNPVLNGPRLTRMPARAAAASTSNASSDLRATRAVQTNQSSTSSFDLPLAQFAVSGLPAGGNATADASPVMPATTVAAPAVAQKLPDAGPSTVVTAVQQPVAGPSTVAPPPAAVTASSSAAPPPIVPSPSESDDNNPEAFITFETQRIRDVLKASSAVTDDSTRSKIVEACMQRIQLLSNLRSLIQGAGTRSRVALAAIGARAESDRIALVTKLFGSDAASHWAPKETDGVVVAPKPEIDNEPGRVLRDSSQQFSEAQKKRALFVFLGRAPATEDQQLWLIPMIEQYVQ